ALLIFFGVRSYRENAGGGRLTFGRGFTVGILINLISCACHVATFEILYFKLVPTLGAKIAVCMVQRAKDSGADRKKVDATAKLAETLRKLYDRPATNAALSFAESFPVGLVMTVVSAAVLRKKGAVREN